MLRLFRTCLAASMALAATFAGAQGFPTRPVTMVVPYAPGGTGEILGRSLAAEMTKQLGQNVIIELKPGAGGNIGAELVAKNAKPDGYTLLFTATSLASNASLMRKMPFDPLKDLAPVAPMAAIPTLAVVNPGLPVKSIGDLIALARKDPGKLTFGSSGNGTSNHLSAELFKVMAGVDLTHVPYKSAGPALTDLIGGQIDVMFDLMPSALGQVKQGRLRAIAVTSAARSPVLPDVPTVAESGVPGYEFTAWFGLFAPAGTPKEVIDRLNAAVTKAVQSPEMRERIAQQGADPLVATPEEFGRFFRGEVDKWARVVRDGKIPTLDN